MKKFEMNKNGIEIELDFSYPKDFWNQKLRGKPLKKVCFIGKNGVGKTRILNEIKEQDQSVMIFEHLENGLFPKNQKDVVEKTMEKYPDSQNFFSTHSPIIASCFEPCEIFPLVFGENEYEKAVYLEYDLPFGSIGWSSDEMLSYWFHTDSRNKKYYEAYNLRIRLEYWNDQTEEMRKELETLKNGTHPKYGNILNTMLEYDIEIKEKKR